MVKVLSFILISHTMLNYLPVFLYFFKIFFVAGVNTVSSELPSCILSTFLWYNKGLLISKKPIHFKHFSNNNLIYVNQMFCDMRNPREWAKLKHEFNLSIHLYFHWMQLIHSIRQKWKNIIKNNRVSENNLFIWTAIW